MQENSYFIELSVSGKWISLVRKWLNDNAPCDMEKVIMELTPLMPTHIRKGDRQGSQISLISDAMRRIYGTVPSGTRVGKPPKRKCKSGDTGLIRDAIASGKTVSRSDFPGMKNFGRLASQMCKRGECVRLRRGHYSPVDSLPNHFERI